MWMLFEVTLSFGGLLVVCFLVSKITGRLFRYVLKFQYRIHRNALLLKYKQIMKLNF